MQIQELSNWEFIILINLLEREIKRTKDRNKEDALKTLKTKLQSVTLGDMPFNIKIDLG